MTPADQRKGYVLGFIGVVIFGGTLPATRLAVEVFDPWFITAARALLASLAAALFLIVLRKRFPRGQFLRLAAISLCLVAGFPVFSSLAMVTVPAVHGGVVLGILPLATAMAAVLVNAERPSLLFWVWGGLGAALVVTFAVRDGGISFATGDLWLLASVASAALGYALSGQLSRGLPGWEVISWALVIALPVTVPATWVLWTPAYAGAGEGAWSGLLYLGFFSMFLGFFAWNAGLALGGVAKVGQVQLLQTFVTLAISAVVLDEKITPVTLLFAAVIVAVVAMGRRSQVTRKLPAEACAVQNAI